MWSVSSSWRLWRSLTFLPLLPVKRAPKACDISITAYITKALTDAIYSGGVMIDTSGNPPILTIDDLKDTAHHPQTGFAAGNGVQFEAKIATLVRHAAPEPSAVYFDGSFFTDKDIRSTSIIYALGPQPQKLKTTLNQTQWSAAGTYACRSDVPSPVRAGCCHYARAKISGRLSAMTPSFRQFSRSANPKSTRPFPSA